MIYIERHKETLQFSPALTGCMRSAKGASKIERGETVKWKTKDAGSDTGRSPQLNLQCVPAQDMHP